MDFETKVKSMSASDIIRAMTKSLRNPHVQVKMSTFGSVKNGVCFGCAATNTLCEIAGKTFDSSLIQTTYGRTSFLTGGNIDEGVWFFVNAFEGAIDCLRTNDIAGYNHYARNYDFAEIHITDYSLPKLRDSYTEAQLDEYDKFADLLEG